MVTGAAEDEEMEEAPDEDPGMEVNRDMSADTLYTCTLWIPLQRFRRSSSSPPWACGGL